MKTTILFFIIGLSVASCFVLKQEISFDMPYEDSESVLAVPEQTSDDSGEISDFASDETDQADNPVLYSCNSKECKRVCWESFQKAGKCYKDTCQCR